MLRTFCWRSMFKRSDSLCKLSENYICGCNKDHILLFTVYAYNAVFHPAFSFRAGRAQSCCVRYCSVHLQQCIADAVMWAVGLAICATPQPRLGFIVWALERGSLRQRVIEACVGSVSLAPCHVCAALPQYDVLFVIQRLLYFFSCCASGSVQKEGAERLFWDLLYVWNLFVWSLKRTFTSVKKSFKNMDLRWYCFRVSDAPIGSPKITFVGNIKKFQPFKSLWRGA